VFKSPNTTKITAVKVVSRKMAYFKLIDLFRSIMPMKTETKGYIVLTIVKVVRGKTLNDAYTDIVVVVPSKTRPTTCDTCDSSTLNKRVPISFLARS
jgi:methyl coenzyme M reductase subunit C